MNYHFITIEGNIGAGKTTLAKLLSRHFDSQLILEEFADNPFLPKFYENRQQYAFPLELFFMAERYKQLKHLLQKTDLFHQTVISDYLFVKSLLFARVNLPDAEFHLYRRLFNIINPQLIKPDLLIYLHASVDKLQENIRKRNRSYEQSIDPFYLSEIETTYIQYIRQNKPKTLFINVEHTDFLNKPEHFRLLTQALEKDYQPGINLFDVSDDELPIREK